MTIRKRQRLQGSGSQRMRIQAASGSPAVLDAETATFSGAAYTGGVMYPRQFPDGVVVDLAGLEIPSQSLMSCREHNPMNVVGSTTEIVNDRRQLHCSGILTGTDDTVLTMARRAKQVNARAPWQFSIDSDFDRMDLQYLPPGQSTVVNGQRITGPMPIVRRATLRRIDFVTKGGDRKAWASIKAAGGERTMTFEEWLASLGFTDLAALSDEQKTKLQAFYDEEVAEATEQEADPAAMEEDPASVSAGSGRKSLTAAGGRRTLTASSFHDETQQLIRDRRAAITAEAARTTAIGEICKRYGNPEFKVQGKMVTLEAHAIEAGWDAKETELHALRESRPTAPAGRTGTIEASADALIMSQLMAMPNLQVENALPHRYQIEAAGSLPAFLFEDVNSDSKQRLLEAAHGFQGMSSVDFAREAIQLDGRRVYGGTRGVIEAAGSTASLGNIISTTVKTALAVSFKSHKDTTEGWVEVDDGPNFLPTPAVGMKTPGGELPPLPDSGTAHFGHLSDKGELIKVGRFAEQLNIDEMTLINDQLGLIMKTVSGPEGYGVKSANVRPGLIYSLIKENGNMADGNPFFYAARGNLQGGAALSSTSLAAAIALLQLAGEVGADGAEAILSLNATHLLVTPTLFTLAGSLANSEYLGAIAASQVPTANPFLEFGLQRITEPRLEKTTRHTLKTESILAGSSSTWFVISADAPPILCRYLQATGRVPRVRTTPLNSGKWGMNLDVSLDVGAALIRPQSMIKSQVAGL